MTLTTLIRYRKGIFIKDGSKIMEKTIDFGHKTNGNKACFNASQKIKHYQIDPKKNKDPFKKAQVNPSISWKSTFFKNGNKKVTDNSIQIIPKNTNTNTENQTRSYAYVRGSAEKITPSARIW